MPEAICLAYRRIAQWRRAAQSILEHADVAAVSRQVELAPVHDGKLDVSAMA
jgi:hypothetical protein